MLAKVWTCAVVGLEGELVQVINYAKYLAGLGRVTPDSGHGRLYRLAEWRPLDRRVKFAMADADRLVPLN